MTPEQIKQAFDTVVKEITNKDLNSVEIECQQLQHAMQTAITLKIEYGDTLASPKHLRVGVDSALIDSAAVATVLVAKGIISETEYMAARLMLLRLEINARTEEISKILNNPNIILQ